MSVDLPAPILLQADEIRVEARNVSRVLPGPLPVTLVRDISVSFRAGELAVISGPSGSGKSSLLYLLGLLDLPSSGEILISGQSTANLSSEALANLRLSRLGFVFQFHFLLPEFDALTNVTLPMRQLGGLTPSQCRERGAKLLSDLGLAGRLKSLPSQLSGGERQRVAIARALANDPAVLLADEPTGNLDSKNGRLVFDTFLRLAEQENRTVIVVTHDANLANLAHRQIRLRDGMLDLT